MSNCPTEEQLKAFASGCLSEDAFEKMANHIENCLSCDTALEKLEASEDAFLTQLQSIQKSRDSIPSDVLDAAMSAADGVSKRGAIDPGKAYAEKLTKGDVQIGKFQLLSKL